MFHCPVFPLPSALHNVFLCSFLLFSPQAPNDAREDFVLCITCGDPVREGSVRVGFPYEADDAVDSRDDTRPEFSFLHLEVNEFF